MAPEMSVVELSERLAAADPSFVLLDIREPDEWQIARLEGATFLSMREIPTRLDELDPEHTYAVMCHHGVRSAMVTAFLQQNGFPNAFNVTGGIDAYAQIVDSAVPLY